MAFELVAISFVALSSDLINIPDPACVLYEAQQ